MPKAKHQIEVMCWSYSSAYRPLQLLGITLPSHSASILRRARHATSGSLPCYLVDLIRYDCTRTVVKSSPDPHISAGLSRVSAEQVQFYRKSEKFGVALSFQSTSNGSEVYMHIEASASDQWAAVGTGDAMDGSLMFVMYPGEAGHGTVISCLFVTRLTAAEVVLSVRSAHSHHEPDEVEADVEILTSGIDDGVMQAKAKWKLDDSKRFSGVDVASKKQPWIWAVGPSEGKDGDWKEANNRRSPKNELEQHSSYGMLRKSRVRHD